jgi:hypothetical protein
MSFTFYNSNATSKEIMNLENIILFCKSSSNREANSYTDFLPYLPFSKFEYLNNESFQGKSKSTNFVIYNKPETGP